MIKSGKAAGLTEMGGKKSDNGFVLIARDRTYSFMADTNTVRSLSLAHLLICSRLGLCWLRADVFDLQEKYEWIQNLGEIMMRLRVGQT